MSLKAGSSSREQRGFTLIELLIVIAIMLILVAGELKVTRSMLRSSTLARDVEAASSILETEMATLRSQGVAPIVGTHPFPIPPAEVSDIPPGASGEVVYKPLPDKGLIQVEMILRWRSVTGPRELALASLFQPLKEVNP